MATMWPTGADTSARKTYDLIDEPADDDYRALIDSSLVQCDTAILSVPKRDVPSDVTAVLERLQPFSKCEPLPGPTGNMHRYRLDRESAAVFKSVASRLYAWRRPSMPSDLCLMRTDGSPWLVSVASAQLGYVELTPFEKLLLGHGSPPIGHILAHQGAKDAVLAVFERGFERATEFLHDEVRSYAETTAVASREGLVETLRDWLSSDEQTRMTVAVDLAVEFELAELADDIVGMCQAMLADTDLAPHVYSDSPVLRDRWRARYIRQLDGALAVLAPQSPHRRPAGSD